MNLIGKFFNVFGRKASDLSSLFRFRSYDAQPRFNDYNSDRQKLLAALRNPALLKIISLQCDMFSQGRVYVYDKNDNELPDDPFLQRLKRPNPLQTETQFLWDFMFWNMLGTANCYVDSSLVENQKNKFYFLDPSKIEWPQEFQNEAEKLIFSDAEIKKRDKTVLKYRYSDGSGFAFTLDKLMIINDLTNGLGNYYKSPSRIDALTKIISNSESALDSKNINVRYTGKFLVGSSGALNSTGLKDDEKQDIRDKMDSEQTVWPVKTMIDIKRFVENMGNLALDEAYLKDYFLIGNMYNIPRDVLEAYNSSTFENQEKARGGHVAYTLQPKGDDFFDAFEDHFGYTEQGKQIVIDWSHLPFMKVFEQDEVEVKSTTIDNFEKLITLGVPLEEVNAYLDLDFTIEQKENGTTDATGQAQGSEAQQEESSGASAGTQGSQETTGNN